MSKLVEMNEKIEGVLLAATRRLRKALFRDIRKSKTALSKDLKRYPTNLWKSFLPVRAKQLKKPRNVWLKMLKTQENKIKAVLFKMGLPHFYFISSSVSRIISGAIFSRSFFFT